MKITIGINLIKGAKLKDGRLSGKIIKLAGKTFNVEDIIFEKPQIEAFVIKYRGKRILIPKRFAS